MGTGGLFLRKLRSRITDEPTGFFWLEKDRVAGSGYPASRSQVGWLLGRGVKSVLTLTEAPLPKEWVQGLTLTLEHMPMKDHQAPEVGDLDRAAAYVQREAEGGKTILVHCLAGQGRTGCVLAAYLVRSKGLTAAEAMRKVREVRPGAIERTQEEAVFDYASVAGANKKAQD